MPMAEEIVTSSIALARCENEANNKEFADADAVAADGERERFDRYAAELGDRDVAFQLLFEEIWDFNKYPLFKRHLLMSGRASSQSSMRSFGIYCRYRMQGDYLMLQVEKEAIRRLEELNISLRDLEDKIMVINEETFPISWSLAAYCFRIGVLTAGTVTCLLLVKDRLTG